MGAQRADAIIVGGGCIGTSIAWHLTRRGLKPVLFEKGLLGAGNTGRSAGGIRAQFASEVNVRMSLYSISFFERFRELTGGDAEFHQCGYLFLAVTPEQEKHFRERIDLQKRLGVDVTLMEPAAVAARWPFLRTDDVLAATWSPRDGVAGPYEVTVSFAQAARRGGAAIHEEAEVTGLIAKGGVVRGVRTAAGEFLSDHVIVAAGPDTPALVGPIGVNLPITPYRRHLYMTEKFTEIPDDIPLIIDSGSGLYFRKETGGIMMGMVDKNDPPTTSMVVDDAYLEKLVEAALARVPCMERANIMNGWAGLYDSTPDHHAILGRSDEVKGLVLAVGFSGHGFMHCPAVGAVISEIVVDGAPKSVDISRLSLNRFAAGAVAEETNVI
jgi:sarcosine oxidase subunit beta